MKIKVVKFGGSSLADARQIEKARDIIMSDPDRRYIVVSAAGKRHNDDDKMTDLFINCHEIKDDEIKRKTIEDKIRTRYIELVKDLDVDFDVEKELDYIFEKDKNETHVDFIASRGEYLSAKIISKYLNATFLDMAGVIIFDKDRKIDYDTSYASIRTAIEKVEKDYKDKSVRIIIPGFYGSTEDDDVVTFSRGGSDITGAVVARALNADIYENWTDVSGVMFADPRMAPNAKTIEYITYTELRELSYMGANVLHEATVYPVSKVGIPINILNTNSPSDKGTMIIASIPSIAKRNVVTGIAGRKGFTSILLQRALMNEEVGYLSRLLKIFENENIPIEHCPTGIDTISIVMRSEFLNGKKDKIIQKIKDELAPDLLNIEENLSLFAVVGEGIV